MKKKYIYIALIIMAVGLAVTATTLFINGGIRIASLEEDFDIYFSSAVLDGVDKTNMFVTDDKQHITFETNRLKEVGDSSTLEFEVTNNSTQYDAHVDISCISDVQGYVTLTTSEDSFDIVAQTRKSGTLTVSLVNGADHFIDGTITCSLNAVATERETRLEKTLVDPDYQITGTLVDENGNPLEDKNLVVFSNTPHYVTTDNYGFFYVGGLEKGSHEIYYMGDTENLEYKTKEEIKSSSLDSASLTTSDISIKFDDISLDGFIVEPVKTGKVDITFNANGGSEEETKKVDLYTRAKDLPIPTRTGYTFKEWIYNGKKVLPTTIINDNKELEAAWEINKYKIYITGSGFKASKNEIEIEYNENATVDITPSADKYIESVQCDGGYTTNAIVGTETYGVQNILIKSNGKANGSVCTITMHSRSYAASYLAATPKYHVHTGNSSSGGGCYTVYHAATPSHKCGTYEWVSGGGACEHGCSNTFRCSGCGNIVTTNTSCDYNPGDGSCTNWGIGDHMVGGSSAHYDLGCGKNANSIDSYSCSSGTLVGDKCYYCPQGGTLSGTTCVF